MNIRTFFLLALNCKTPLTKCGGKTCYEIRDLLTSLWLHLLSRRQKNLSLGLCTWITSLLAAEFPLSTNSREGDNQNSGCYNSTFNVRRTHLHISLCLFISNLPYHLYLVHIALEIPQVLSDKYLFPSLATSDILVRIIATGEDHVWWPSILTKELTTVFATCWKTSGEQTPMEKKSD